MQSQNELRRFSTGERLHPPPRLQADIPPARLATFVNPWFARKCATRMDLPPAWHMTIVSASRETPQAAPEPGSSAHVRRLECCASCSSQSSRTSRTSGFSPRSRRALSSSHRNLADHGFGPLRTETAPGRRGIFERVDGGLEQARAAPGGLGGAGDQQCFLRQARRRPRRKAFHPRLTREQSDRRTGAGLHIPQ